jgi:hypothetical protein
MRAFLKITSIAAICCLALTACGDDDEPVFEASSVQTYQKSLGKIKAKLSASDQRKLQVALMTLVAGIGADDTAYVLANPSGADDIEELKGGVNTLIFLDRMRPAIDGKTAAAVIARVGTDLDYAIAKAESEGGVKKLAAFVIENARFNIDRNNRYNALTAEFSVYNGSEDAIAMVYANGEFTARELASPIRLGNIAAHFLNLLQPGAQEQIEKVQVTLPGPWTRAQLENIYDGDLKLRVWNVGDAHGKLLVSANLIQFDAMRKKRDLLRGSS